LSFARIIAMEAEISIVTKQVGLISASQKIEGLRLVT